VEAVPTAPADSRTPENVRPPSHHGPNAATTIAAAASVAAAARRVDHLRRQEEEGHVLRQGRRDHPNPPREGSPEREPERRQDQPQHEAVVVRIPDGLREDHRVPEKSERSREAMLRVDPAEDRPDERAGCEHRARAEHLERQEAGRDARDRIGDERLDVRPARRVRRHRMHGTPSVPLEAGTQGRSGDDGRRNGVGVLVEIDRDRAVRDVRQRVDRQRGRRRQSDGDEYDREPGGEDPCASIPRITATDARDDPRIDPEHRDRGDEIDGDPRRPAAGRRHTTLAREDRDIERGRRDPRGDDRRGSGSVGPLRRMITGERPNHTSARSRTKPQPLPWPP
jgi:hypothetical protein